MPSKCCFSINEAAEYSSVGRQTLRNLIKEKKIPCLLVGTRQLILVQDLENFLFINRGKDLLDMANLESVELHENRMQTELRLRPIIITNSIRMEA